MTHHKVYDQNNQLVFEGGPEEVYEFILKTRAVKDEDSKIKYENYLKNKKK